MPIKQFLLFNETSTPKGSRKDFVQSFDSLATAIEAGRKKQRDTGLQWHIIDSATSTRVAQDPAAE